MAEAREMTFEEALARIWATPDKQRSKFMDPWMAWGNDDQKRAVAAYKRGEKAPEPRAVEKLYDGKTIAQWWTRLSRWSEAALFESDDGARWILAALAKEPDGLLAEYWSQLPKEDRRNIRLASDHTQFPRQSIERYLKLLNAAVSLLKKREQVTALLANSTDDIAEFRDQLSESQRAILEADPDSLTSLQLDTLERTLYSFGRRKQADQQNALANGWRDLSLPPDRGTRQYKERMRNRRHARK